MDPNSLGSKMVRAVEGVSSAVGTGNVVLDVTVLALLVSLISVFLALWFLRKLRSQPGLADLPFAGGLAGRVENAEITLNQLRTDLNRAVEGMKADVGFVRNQCKELAEKVSRIEESLSPKRVDSDRDRNWAEAPRPSSPITASVYSGSDRSHLDVEDEEQHEDRFANRGAQPATTTRPVPPEPLAQRLESSRKGLLGRIRELFQRKPQLDAAQLNSLEELLLGSDLGVKVTERLLNELREKASRGVSYSEDQLIGLLRDRIMEVHNGDGAGALRDRPSHGPEGPLVVLVVGVNGVGKTTTVAKLASRWRSTGAKVMMIAADTFRAAAVKQLETWGERINVPVVTGPEGAKPSTVVFDGMEQARRENFDVVIIDTAGRLHTKTNLMNELEGIRSTIARHVATAPQETLLVVDGSTGQNALAQAREFHAAVPLTGLIVTKLDGTAKGGIVVAIKQELGVPVRFIGVGEGRQDLRPFVPHEFAAALL